MIASPWGAFLGIYSESPVVVPHGAVRVVAAVAAVASKAAK
jgi:hypothetical protein